MVAPAAAHQGRPGPAGRHRRAHRLHRRSPRSTCPTVGDEGELPDSLPVPVPARRAASPWTPCTIIAPYALAMALVGLLESLLTAKLVDDITDTHSDKTREAVRPGHRQHRHRLLRRHGRLRHDRPDDDQREGVRRPHPAVHLPRRRVPAGPVRRLRRRRRRHPDGRPGRRDDHGLGRRRSTGTPSGPRPCGGCRRSETTVMVVTVAVTVATHNLAIGVVVGVLTAMVDLRPAGRPPRRDVTASSSRPRRHHHGRLPRHRRAVLRLLQRPRTRSSTTPTTPTTSSSTCRPSHIWDASSVAALDAIATKYAPQAARPSRSSASTPRAPSSTNGSPAPCRATDDRPSCRAVRCWVRLMVTACRLPRPPVLGRGVGRGHRRRGRGMSGGSAVDGSIGVVPVRSRR